MENRIIKIIESLNKIMATWERLTLRRTLLTSFTVILFTQTIITTILWIAGREISNTWLGILTVQHSSWTIMVSWYFSDRKKERERDEKRRYN
jgi:hypothetical protein